MNVSLESTDKINGVLTAVIEPADYQEKYKKAIKDFRKKASMPGFRKGMVPEGLIKKQYGKEILAEQINNLLNEVVTGYIKDNKVNMLGEPLPVEDNTISLNDGDTFTFKFGIAIAPEFKVEVSKSDKVKYYDVQVADELVDRQVDAYRQRGGSYDKVDSYVDNDMVKGTLTQLDENGAPVEGGLVVEDAIMLPKYFKNEDQKAIFNEAKPEGELVFNPSVAYDGNAANVSSLLKVKSEEADNYKGDFKLQVKEITRYVPGPLNEELFSQVYPSAGIKTADEFKAKIKGDIKAQFDKGADYRFIHDFRAYMLEKVGKLEYPEEKLKEIMKNRVEDPSKVEEAYEKNIEELTWHLIKEQIVEQNQIKIDDKDVRDMAAEATREQFAQYGMLDIPQEYIEESVKNMLSKKETVERLIDSAIENKIAATVKGIVTLDVTPISTEDFNNLPR